MFQEVRGGDANVYEYLGDGAWSQPNVTECFTDGDGAYLKVSECFRLEFLLSDYCQYVILFLLGSADS